MKRIGNLALVDFGKDSDPSNSAIQRMVNGHRINEVPMPEGIARRITPEMAKILKDHVNKAASEIAKEHGVQVSIVLQSLDETDEQLEQDVVIKFSASCPVGQDRFAKTLLRKGQKYKVHPSFYGHSFVKGNTEYIITGLDDSDRKNPMLRLRNPNGNIMADSKQVIQFLKHTEQVPDLAW